MQKTPGGAAPSATAEARRILSGLRRALGWAALGWFLLLVAHLGIRKLFIAYKPQFLLDLWGTTLPAFLNATLQHLLAMRLVFLVVLTAWIVVWLWERRI